MTSLSKIQVIAVAFVLIIPIAIIACSEKTEENSKVETSVSPVSEDKIAQLQREAQEGDPDAQYNLGYMYENGLGIPKNEAKALELYQNAADQGHSGAQTNLDAIRTSK